MQLALISPIESRAKRFARLFFLFRPKNYYKLSLHVTFSNTFGNLEYT